MPFRITEIGTQTAWVVASDAKAEAKAFAQKLQNSGYPVWVCDGIDDNVQIQAAINALPASGGKVLLSEGTFYLAAGAALVSNMVLEGMGRATILRPMLGVGLTSLINGSAITRVTVRNLYVNGRDTNNVILVGYLVNFTDTTHLLVEGVLGEHASDDIIALDNCQYFWILNNRTGGLTTDALVVESGIEVEDGSAFGVIANNICEGRENGITVAQHAGQPAWSDIVIANNIVSGVSGSGISLATSDGPSFGQRAIVIGNMVLNWGVEGIQAAFCTDVNIIGNLVRHNLAAVNNGIRCSGVRAFVSDNRIQSNYTIAAGVYMENSTAVVCGNRIWRCGWGVRVSGASPNCSVVNNHIQESVYHGIWVEDTSHYFLISGNYVMDAAAQGPGNPNDGIHISGGNTGFIIGNKVIRDVNQPRYGIRIDAGVTASVVRQNDLANSGVTANLSDAGTASVIEKNRGWLTENSGAASITAGLTSVNVTHGLATIPTRVILTPTTDTAGRRFWVSAKAAATFTVTIDSTHVSDISFDWRAQVGEG